MDPFDYREGDVTITVPATYQELHDQTVIVRDMNGSPYFVFMGVGSKRILIEAQSYVNELLWLLGRHRTMEAQKPHYTQTRPGEGELRQEQPPDSEPPRDAGELRIQVLVDELRNYGYEVQRNGLVRALNEAGLELNERGHA